MVFQTYAVWPHRTVYQNVAFGLEVRRVPRREIRERVARMLELVTLAGLEDRYPAQLSGGQQQRVALARSLVVEPGILLLDEPLSNLDAKLRERMRWELKELQRRTGITFVYVTHDQSEAMALSDRIAVMHLGELMQVGAPREVYTRPANRIVADFMGLVNLIPARVVRAGENGLVAIGDHHVGIELPPSLAEGQAVHHVPRQPHRLPRDARRRHPGPHPGGPRAHAAGGAESHGGARHARGDGVRRLTAGDGRSSKYRGEAHGPRIQSTGTASPLDRGCALPGRAPGIVAMAVSQGS
jgi:ABC-type Fe3+/spermidine/putrescine transport system ATPase subunit